MFRLFDTISHKLTAAVADAGTFTVGYPEGRTAGEYLAYDQEMPYGAAVLYAPADFTVAYGASEITVTNATGGTLENGEQIYLTCFRSGDADTGLNDGSIREKRVLGVNLGSPATADADGVCASQAGTTLTINGALASGGVATFDAPRNVVAAWTTTATCTVTGTDEHGATVVETSASGTSMTGAKAFKTVPSVVMSTAVTGATVGSGVILGLPIFLAEAGAILKELQDGAAATAGTTVVGDRAEATATTGDVRGTYSPNSAPNGSRAFELIVAFDDPGDVGVAQFAG